MGLELSRGSALAVLNYLATSEGVGYDTITMSNVKELAQQVKNLSFEEKRRLVHLVPELLRLDEEFLLQRWQSARKDLECGHVVTIEKSSSKGQSETPRYQVVLSRAAAKDLQRLPPKLIEQLQNRCLPALSVNPRSAGNPKHGPLAGLYSYNFGPRGGYRIVYEIIDSKRLVLVIALGPHDQAYRRARRRR